METHFVASAMLFTQHLSHLYSLSPSEPFAAAVCNQRLLSSELPHSKTDSCMSLLHLPGLKRLAWIILSRPWNAYGGTTSIWLTT
jgi:hypothetical protein